MIQLTFVGHPPYNVAHPDESEPELCTKCALARRSDTGETLLLWCCGGINWSVSRHDPQHARHREEIPLDALAAFLM